ncbi:hypothetical protein NQ314_008591 [Rhamnusium bicolor]|uniref:Uncharacterized protein n=1 Tax=Rhamnusium bicolor TaxID=1586634 RepID=A0AAV8YAM7_9CUCU|nr:hypothetical protein NQ314_008591 [Rhamnusium bicolor]
MLVSNKSSTTSPIPAAAVWSLRQTQPVPEGYQYNQPNPLSPGPTYTQLSGGSGAGTGATPAPYQYQLARIGPNIRVQSRF